jgi:phage terminase large subunit-like protein
MVGDQRLGSTEPRLFTEALVPLDSTTSLGFEFIDFAQQVVGIELLPWQRWWAIHAFELNEDGRFRFRTVLTMVARQNGKTVLMKLVALWKMYLGHAREVLGVAQTRDVAKDTWQECIDLVEDIEDLAVELAGQPRMANGQENFQLANGSRYRIAAANRKGGRSKSIDLLMIDEIREWLDYEAWGAVSKTTMAKKNSQTLAFSNAGDKRSVVLKTLRGSALGHKNQTLALFEWSAPEGCALDDREAWAMANPSMGYTIDEESILSALDSDPAPVFRTEVLCQEVESLDEALDITAWNSMADARYIIGDIEKPRIVLGIDVSLDGSHVSLIAVAKSADGLIYAEPVDGWNSTGEVGQHLEDWINKIQPKALAWLPGGPSGPLAADIRGMATLRFKGQIEPLKVVEVTGVGVKEACQGLADLVASRRVAHPGDPMLDAHVLGAQRYDQGDGWRYARKGAAPIDGVYALAAAVHVLRSLPEEPSRKSFVY